MRPHPASHPIATCSKPLAANASAAPMDVIKMKSTLGALGHYEAPKWGVSQFPDVALFDAIKAFQKSQGLKVDGTIKPSGETEAALSQAVTPRRAKTALQATAQALQSLGRGGDELLAHITKEEAVLLHNATDGASINPQTGLLEFFWGGADRDDDGNGYDNDAQHGESDASAAAASDAQSAENDQQGKDDTSDNDSHKIDNNNSGPAGGDAGLGGHSLGGIASGDLTDTKQDQSGTKVNSNRAKRNAAQNTADVSFTSGFLDTNVNEDDDLDAQDGYTNPSQANDDQAVENENQNNAFKSAAQGDPAGYGDMTPVDAVNKARTDPKDPATLGFWIDKQGQLIQEAWKNPPPPEKPKPRPAPVSPPTQPKARSFWAAFLDGLIMDEEEQEKNNKKMKDAIKDDVVTPTDPREPRDPNDPGNGPSASSPVTSAPSAPESAVSGPLGALTKATLSTYLGYHGLVNDYLAGPDLLGPGYGEGYKPGYGPNISGYGLPTGRSLLRK